MKAILRGKTLVDSEDVVEHDGYPYLPRSAVRMELLELADKTASDRACLHGVRGLFA